MSEFASADGVKKLVERFNAAHAHVAYDRERAGGEELLRG